MSSKTFVIERIFRERWNEAAQTLSNPAVTLTELQQAIEAHNVDHPDERLSTRNVANFFKDFIRKRTSANRNWPANALDCRFTARQVTGANNSFEFVPFDADQTEPFPVHSFVHTSATPRHKIESVSLPLTSRRLGRSDEPWLVQVLVRLRVLETHFSLNSPHEIIQLDHLQMAIKLRRTEIDALFLAISTGSQSPMPDDETEQDVAAPPHEIIVVCEAKGLRDDILEDQILNQLRAIFGQPSITQDLAIAVAVKAIGQSEIHLIEFESVRRDQVGALEQLAIASDAIYEFVPPIPGIGE